MYGTLNSLAVTVVAVLGTLVSALLAQRQAHRAATRQLARLDDRRAAARDEEARRAGYTALNTSARRYLTALTNQVHALRNGAGPARGDTELHRARAAHADVYAEFQLIAPDPVLAPARTVNRTLNHTYGMLMRLAQGTDGPGDSLDAAQARITGLWDHGLTDLRTRMRLDLGVTDSVSPALPG
jgi:hypothetical protein